jgi:GTP-binding protein EngB required for normal cell division
MGSELLYDVAISYASAQATEARALADVLKRMGVLVFYDEDTGADFWGRPLVEYLFEVYSHQARLCVLFVSKDYAESIWARHEFRASLSRAIRDKSEYILPIRFDDTKLPGMSSDIGSVPWTTPEDIALKLCQKLLDLARRTQSSNLPSAFSLENTLKRLRSLEGQEMRYNIVVLGRAGVGKSSLINYLFEEPLRPVGIGGSMTPPGFHPHDAILQGVPVSIFDSEGITLANVDDWSTRLEKELMARSSGEPIERWFHTILYCIGAGGSRIDPVDVRVIDLLLQKDHQVIVAFTKADQITEEECRRLREHLLVRLGTELPTVNACSVERKIAGGVVVRRFGVDTLQDAILQQFWQMVQRRLPKRCIHLLNFAIDEWAVDQKKRVDATVGFLTPREGALLTHPLNSRPLEGSRT